MVKEKFYRAILKVSELGIKLLNRPKYAAINYFEREKWRKFFGDADEYIYTADNGVKFNLYRKSKLTELLLFYNFESEELDFVQNYLKPGDCFIDIGANIGLFTLYASFAVKEKGKVYCFEPTPSTFERLSKNIKLNNVSNVVATNIGLSDQNSSMFINESSSGYDAWNTFADVQNMEQETAIMFSKRTQVEVRTLDSFVAEHNIEAGKVSLVKIDVEGWEKFVLQGGKDFFTHADAPVVMMEFTEKNTWAAGYMSQELYDLMVEYGYSWYVFDFKNSYLVPDPKRFQYPYNNLIAVKPTSSLKNRLRFKD